MTFSTYCVWRYADDFQLLLDDGDDVVLSWRRQKEDWKTSRRVLLERYHWQR